MSLHDSVKVSMDILNGKCCAMCDVNVSAVGLTDDHKRYSVHFGLGIKL